MAGLGVASFVGGLSESSVLVLMTLTADSLIRGTLDISVAGMEVSRTTAVLLAMALVFARVCMTVIASLTAARFASSVMVRAQRDLLDVLEQDLVHLVMQGPLHPLTQSDQRDERRQQHNHRIPGGQLQPQRFAHSTRHVTTP